MCTFTLLLKKISIISTPKISHIFRIYQAHFLPIFSYLHIIPPHIASFSIKMHRIFSLCSSLFHYFFTRWLFFEFWIYWFPINQALSHPFLSHILLSPMAILNQWMLKDFRYHWTFLSVFHVSQIWNFDTLFILQNNHVLRHEMFENLQTSPGIHRSIHSKSQISHATKLLPLSLSVKFPFSDW